jgi:hypothetical protein
LQANPVIRSEQKTMNKDQEQQNPQQPTELNEAELQDAQGGVLIGLLLPAVQKVRVSASSSTSITDGTSNITQKVRDGSA